MAKAKKEEKILILDLKGSFNILKTRGLYDNWAKLLEELNYNRPTVDNWNGKAPYVVFMVYKFMCKSKLSFPDVMKLIKSEETPNVLCFLLDYCNETGLTFEEIVKEV